ncbi:MAG: DUF2500 domain-containing protein [Oscillospiraceae bacterium]|nr:DUF2500 domain-containing protein [Oscillospiraceae bacterium]
MDSFFYIWILFIGIAILWPTVQWICSRSKPQVSTEAQIIAIDDRNSGKIVRSHQKVLLNLSRERYITFELLPNSGRKKFFVPRERHKQLAVGDTGVLTAQGIRYISFRTTVSAKRETIVS